MWQVQVLYPAFEKIMDHATKKLEQIRNSGEYTLVADVPVFDLHEEHDEEGKLLKRFGREELQEVCDNTNARCIKGDPAIVGLGHTIPRDKMTGLPVPEDKQPVGVGYGMDFKVGQFGPDGRTGILANYYIRNDKLDEWKTYERRSIELWPKTKIIDWIASLRKAPQRDLGLLTFSKDALTPFVPKHKYFADAECKHPLTMARRGEKLFYAMDSGLEEVEDIDQNDNQDIDSDGQKEKVPVDPTKPPDAAAPDDDFSAKIDRYMAEKFPTLKRMCDEATQKYAMESNPGAVGAPAGAKLDPNADAPHGEMPVGGPDEDDDDSTGDDDDDQTGPGYPGATNTSVLGAKKKKKKGNPMADDKAAKDAKDKEEKERMAKDGEAIRYARLEEEVKQLREARVADQAAAKKAKATQRIQSLQFQGFTLDPAREVERYCALDETTWDKEDEHIKLYYKQDSVGMVPMGGTIPTAGMPPSPPSKEKGRLNETQMRTAISVASKKGIPYEDAAAQVLAGQV